MKYGCWLCQISPSSDATTGNREMIRSHLLNDHSLREESIETYLRERTGEQTTLTDMIEAKA